MKRAYFVVFRHGVAICKAGSLVLLIALGVAARAQDTSLPSQAEKVDFPKEWYFEETESQRQRLEGERAPEITGVDWEGSPQSLRALRGKIVVIDFWAAWCPPCIQALQHDVEVVRQFREHGVVMLGIHDGSEIGRRSWPRAKAVAEEAGVNFPLGLDNQSDSKRSATSESYDQRFFPYYVIVDREGIIRAAGVKPGKLYDVIRGLLSESGGNIALAEFPSSVYAGGNSRPTEIQSLEGRQLPDFRPIEWIGSPGDADDGIRVIQFLTQGSAISESTMGKLTDQLSVLETHGARLMAVTGPSADRSALLALSAARGGVVPIAVDTPDANEPSEGRLAGELGVSAVDPLIVVIDRNGIIRAAGLKPDSVPSVVRHVARYDVPAMMPEDTKATPRQER